MCSTRDDAALPAPGFPIRASAGQSLFSSSPRLIAAVHPLLRLLMPRHPPCALLILTVIKAGPEGPAGDTRLRWLLLCSFQGPRRGGVPRSGAGTGARCPGRGRSLKTRQHAADRERSVSWSGRRSRRRRAIRRRRHPKMLPRKEVIQPQLPLRLPCYDFTPIINPTFDGSLPYGLAHRLRVLPTFVV